MHIRWSIAEQCRIQLRRLCYPTNFTLCRWSWLGQLKQPDGGFQLVIDGEEDVR